MSALDRNIRIQVREELLRIHRELGTTFLLVTHDQEEALSVSDRVALMDAGRLVQVGTPEELYRRPKTLFAARFVGAGSLVDVTLREPREGKAEAAIGGIRFTAALAEGTVAGRALLLLRPEDLTAVDPGAGRLDAVVETVAFMGSHYDVTASSLVGPLRLTVARDIAPGERIGVAWPDATGIAYPPEHADLSRPRRTQ
jgi:ABC-type Fe3+/spermidine/putrescine transport system ATPase subunit